MKINELKRIAAENDYELKESLEYETISLARKISLDGLISNYITINSNAENQVFIGNLHCDKKDLNMIKAAVEFAETPPDEREEDKKFYAKHRYFKFHNGSSKYLGMDLVKDKPDLCSKITYKWVKNQFTLKEIEEIKERFNTDLKDFELMEVKE